MRREKGVLCLSFFLAFLSMLTFSCTFECLFNLLLLFFFCSFSFLLWVYPPWHLRLNSCEGMEATSMGRKRRFSIQYSAVSLSPSFFISCLIRFLVFFFLFVFVWLFAYCCVFKKYTPLLTVVQPFPFALLLVPLDVLQCERMRLVRFKSTEHSLQVPNTSYKIKQKTATPPKKMRKTHKKNCSSLGSLLLLLF